MKIYKIAFVALLALSACSGAGEAVEENQVVTLDSGVKLEITQAGDGVLPQSGQKVTVHYKGMLLDSSVFDNSFERGEPITFQVGIGQVIPGWDQGIAQLSKGAKAIITIPAEMAYGAMERPGIPANSTLVFEVEIIDIQDGPQPIAHEVHNVEGIEPIVTPTGLKVYVVEEGTGEQAQPGRMVSVHYHGQLEDGTKFDSSFERGEPIEFMLGQGRVIPGWEEGIAMLNAGAKAQLVIPSELAYGDRGAGGVIPPGATLVFDVELLEVK